MVVEGPMTMTEVSVRVRPLTQRLYNAVRNCGFSRISQLLLLLGGRGRYGDGPYNCNGGDGGK